MKRFLLPFIIALVFHVAIVWGNFDFFNKEPVKPPEITFMTMTLAHVEAPQPIKKPQKKLKKIVKKKTKKNKPVKKIKKKQLIPEPEIVEKTEEKKDLIEDVEEIKEEVEETKGAVAQVKKASPLYSYNPSPRYPRSARQRGWQGVVELLVMVDKHGRVVTVDIHKSSGFKLLDRSAVKTVKNWRFSPAKSGNKPVDSEVVVPVKFNLTG